MDNNFLDIDGVGTLDMSKCSPELLFILGQKPNNLTWPKFVDSIRNVSINTRGGDFNSQLNCAIIKK